MRRILIVLTIGLFAISCGSSDDSNSEGGGTSALALNLPENNSECITGTSVSATQSAVTLEWTAVVNTETYFVYVKNLNTQSTLQFNAAANTSQSVNLSKGTPYSWYVTARKTSGETATSAVWKFYNAGAAVTSHPPFPADLVSPVMSVTIPAGTVTLQWTGGDVDNDITNYKVYMDSNTNPATLMGTVTQTSIANLPVTAGGTYYWKVITADNAGNATISPVFQFKVQ